MKALSMLSDLIRVLFEREQRAGRECFGSCGNELLESFFRYEPVTFTLITKGDGFC